MCGLGLGSPQGSDTVGLTTGSPGGEGPWIVLPGCAKWVVSGVEMRACLQDDCV